MTLYVKELSRHITENFVETGTEEGNGCIAALTVGFENIVSIEASEEYFKKTNTDI